MTDETNTANTPPFGGSGGISPQTLDLQLLADLGARATACEVIQIPTKGLTKRGLPATVPVIWDHRNSRVHEVKSAIEAFRLDPERRTGTAQALTLDSFIALVNRHKDAHSAVFANTAWEAPGFVAVIDYHQNDGEARNGRHKVRYQFPLTDEWKAWLASNGQVMDQGDFAAFIEERIAELSSPSQAEVNELERNFQTKIATPSELIQLSRGLQVQVGLTVKSAKVLQTGEAEVVFQEEHADAAGNKLLVPGLFMLSIPVFFRGGPVRIPVRLRYRAGGGSIKWFYQLYRPDIWVTERIESDLTKVASETKLPTYEGSPEA